MTKKLSRRKFLANSSLVTAGVALGSRLSGSTPAPGHQDFFNLMEEIRKYPKIDAYCTGIPNMAFADKFGIEKMFVGMPMTFEEWAPDHFRKTNTALIDLMKKHPGRVVGQMTLNPLYRKESLEEIDRCTDAGMVGTRLFFHAKINDPVYEPIIKKLTDLKMIIFVHGEAQLGVGGYEMKYDIGRPHTVSRPEDFVEAAKRYPESLFQFAHIGGGSDWEYMCKCFADYPNIYVDTAGSNNEEYMIDFALQQLGEDRLFFGTDNSYYQSIGKIIASGLTESQKHKLFYGNYQALLKRGGYNGH